MVTASQNWTEDANRRSGRASKQPYPAHGDVPDLTSTRHFQCRPSAELTTGYDVDFTNQRFAILRPNRVLKFLAQWYPRDRTGMSVERITPKPRGRPFSKGHSGNPRGRPPGARNAATVLAAVGGNSPQNYHQRIQIGQLLVSEQTPVFAESRRSAHGRRQMRSKELPSSSWMVRQKPAPKQRRLKGPLGEIFIGLRGNSPQSSRQGIHVAQLFVARQTPVSRDRDPWSPQDGPLGKSS
jgi:hypothetical protein